jgi:sporulation protein YlmC with PRC-barrel domain
VEARVDEIGHAASAARIGLAIAALLTALPAEGERIYSDDALVSRLLDAQVVDTRGRALGEVRDLVIDFGEGGRQFVLVESGGMLGLFEELCVYPLRSLAPAQLEDRVVLDADGDAVPCAESAPPGARASELLGSEVRDGAAAGELRDLVVNLGDGSLRHAVIVLGESERQVTIRPELLVRAPDGTLRIER